MIINKTVKVNMQIEGSEVILWVVNVIRDLAVESQDDDYIFFTALGHLVGISDVEAVKYANSVADRKNLPHITTREFRRRLPGVMSKVFAEFMK